MYAKEARPISPALLAELDEVLPPDVRVVPARQPQVVGIVRSGGNGDFITVSVRLADSEPLRLERPALARMAKITRVRPDLLADLPDDLIRNTLNAQLRKRWSWFSHAVVQGERILEWMAPGWEGIALKPSDVAQTCAQALGDGACLAGQPEGDWPETRFLFTTAELSHVFRDSPCTEDRHQFFVGVNLNLLGWTAPVVHAVSYRLVCRNGMMALVGHPGSERKVFAYNRTFFLEKLRSAAVGALGYIRTVLIPRIQESISRPADLETLVARLPEPIAQLVRSAYRAEELGGSEYHLVNALSRAANYPECPRDWADRLRTLAGELTVGRRCWACFRTW